MQSKAMQLKKAQKCIPGRFSGTLLWSPSPCSMSEVHTAAQCQSQAHGRSAGPCAPCPGISTGCRFTVFNECAVDLELEVVTSAGKTFSTVIQKGSADNAHNCTYLPVTIIGMAPPLMRASGVACPRTPPKSMQCSVAAPAKNAPPPHEHTDDDTKG